jgi:hypothetical protein
VNGPETPRTSGYCDAPVEKQLGRHRWTACCDLPRGHKGTAPGLTARFKARRAQGGSVSTNAGNGASFYDLSKEELAGIPERIRDSDWCEAFGYAPFAITDVAEVVAAADGEHDADNWVGIFRLKDGRFGYVTAGCDFTGWDCQANGHGDTRPTLEAVVRELCGDDDRERLALNLDAKEEA